MDTVALRYAEALFALAKEENAIKQYQKDMEAVEAVFHDKSILQFFSHVAIQDEDKYQVLKQSFHGKIQTYVYQFLLLLIKKRRIQCVLLICQQFQQLCYDALGIQVGKVWSAYELTEDQVGFNKYFIVEGAEVQLMFFEGLLLSVSVPEKVELTITETDAAIKGAPSNQTKDAVTETGLSLRVPQFIEPGEKIVVFSTDGKYAGRA